MDENAYISAGRAVASTVIYRYIGIVLLWIVVLFGAVNAIIIILSVALSEWWAILLFLSLPLLGSALLLYLLTRFAATKIAPRKLSRTEKKQTNDFVTTVQNTYVTTHAIKKSPLAMGMSAIYAFITGGREKAVRHVISPIESSKRLKDRFMELVKLFSSQP